MFKEDGSASYVIHKINHGNETLEGISIRYNVRKDLIQRANEFSGDEIFMFKELIIPYSVILVMLISNSWYDLQGSDSTPD